MADMVTFAPASGIGPPVTMQPCKDGVANGCLPGLEGLAALDQLIVRQKVEMCEVLTGCETRNRFTLKSSSGQAVFTALEGSNWCVRNCFGQLRPFKLRVCDLSEREVILLDRPLACQGCLCPCCLQSVEVQCPPGSLAGRVEEIWSFLHNRFVVRDLQGEPVFHIEGPSCCSCQWCSCGDKVFKIYMAEEGEVVGTITKQWTGCCRETFTDADQFSINFPPGIDVAKKALLIGALFLIDIMFFETSQQ